MIGRRARGLDGLAGLFCLICFALCAYYLFAGYGAYLDADMSSELALARHLAEEGTLISDSWYYSTEVRVLNTQLVFTPLMALFPGDWQLVRALGCMILLLMMAASSSYCARMLGADGRFAWMFAGLSMLPCSYLHAQMIVIGAYYIPHAVLTNLLVGLTAGMCRPGRRGVKAALLLLLAAVMGASSIRYMLCAVLPVAAAGAYMAVFPQGGRLQRGSDEAKLLAGALLAAAAGAAGYVLGQKLLGAYCLWNSERYGASRLIQLLSTNLFEILDSALDGLFRAVGYRDGRHLLSMQGLLSVGALGLIGLTAMLTVRTLREKAHSGASRFGALTLVMSAALTLGTFLFVENLYLNRYWLPVMTLSAPVLAACLTREKNTALRRLSALAFAVVIAGLAAVQIRESMASPEIDQGDMENIACVEATGLDFGYATFWNANIVTELTDGRVEVVAIEIAEDAQGGAYPAVQKWLEAEEDTQMNRRDEPVFLLLSDAEAQTLAAFLADCGAAEQAALDNGMRLFVVDSQQQLFEAMQDASGA